VPGVHEAVRFACADRPACQDDGVLVIGLVNNMSDAALRSTERQFGKFLSVSSNYRSVRLRLFLLPEILRSEAARAHTDQHYESIDALWDSHVDGLIVTGAEPRARTLTQEPYWDTLRKLVDWAATHTVSTIWSCLAAHAAVLHLDGIDRSAMDAKLCGVFKARKVAECEMLAGFPAAWPVPHSRFHGLSEDILDRRGYRILSTSEEAGVDVFSKEQDSLFVFLQGHPEYDVSTLFREYRRDAMRFLAGEQDRYPNTPTGYFNTDIETILTTFRQDAIERRHKGLQVDFPTFSVDENVLPRWQGPAECMISNWLSYLAAGKPCAASVPAYASPSATPLSALA
jgi:homoserine O-succinyltransferase